MTPKRKISSLTASLVMMLLALAPATEAGAAVQTRQWTSVGSAGTVAELTTTCPPDLVPLRLMQLGECSPPADPPELVFAGAAIALKTIPGSPILGPDRPLRKQQAVVRYNVVAVEGLFQNGNSIRMKVRFLDTGDESQVVLKLVEHNRQDGTTTVRLTFDSNSYAAGPSYQEQAAQTSSWTAFDFGQNAYYIEATLTRSYRASGADLVGPGLASMQLEKTFNPTPIPR